MSIGGRVYKLRVKRRLSQEELAREAGITQAMLSRIEAGRVPNPGAGTLKGLARALGCSIDYLVELYDDNDTAAVLLMGSPLS